EVGERVRGEAQEASSSQACPSCKFRDLRSLHLSLCSRGQRGRRGNPPFLYVRLDGERDNRPPRQASLCRYQGGLQRRPGEDKEGGLEEDEGDNSGSPLRLPSRPRRDSGNRKEPLCRCGRGRRRVNRCHIQGE